MKLLIIVIFLFLFKSAENSGISVLSRERLAEALLFALIWGHIAFLSLPAFSLFLIGAAPSVLICGKLPTAMQIKIILIRILLISCPGTHSIQDIPFPGLGSVRREIF